MAKRTIDKAKAAKKDEFYTQLEDINNELRHYRELFVVRPYYVIVTTLV